MTENELTEEEIREFEQQWEEGQRRIAETPGRS
jgi:hypothetical protein